MIVDSNAKVFGCQQSSQILIVEPQKSKDKIDDDAGMEQRVGGDWFERLAAAMAWKSKPGLLQKEKGLVLPVKHHKVRYWLEKEVRPGRCGQYCTIHFKMANPLQQKRCR